MTALPTADPRRIAKHMDALCVQIGCRYSGTPEEQRAADYIESQFSSLGLDNPHQHRFTFPNWNYSHGKLTVGRGAKARTIDTAMPMCFSPATPKRGVRGQVVYLGGGGEFEFLQDTRGKIGLMIGSLGLGDPATRARVMNAGLAGLLAVDSRIPYGWQTFLGAAPQWAEGYELPTFAVPFLEAERLVREMPLEVHLEIEASTFPAQSQNVIAEVVGSQHPDEVIVVSGHHDTVLGMVGAEDNASGVIFTLELARLFAQAKPARTLRFVSYGVEEKLSVGSYLYMRSLSPKEQRRLVLAVNADGVASYVGTDVVFVTGTPELEALVQRTWRARRHTCDIRREAQPYSDHFPMNICGVPSVWLSRPSIMTEGYWYLHSAHDNPAHSSPQVLARTVDTCAVLLDQVANAAKLPFARSIAPDLKRIVGKLAREAYGHPWAAETFQYPD